ncbi:MAG: hypothetical protein ACI8UO_003581, partial [Verrucomicrobiales bacterium]
MNPDKHTRRRWIQNAAACGFGALATRALANDDYNDPPARPEKP